MKTFVLVLLLLMPFSVWAQSLVQQLPLDERSVYRIAISQEAPTTIMFPGRITSISSANVTNSGEIDAPIMLSYREGMHFFNLRALTSGASGAVNIVYKNKTYVFSLYENATGMRSITMYETNVISKRGHESNRITSPMALVKLLDKAKTYNFFKMQYPSAIQQIERVCPNSTTLYKNFDVILEEVFRFDPEDTLVFRVKFKNKSDKDIYYQPQQLAVRVGENIYYTSISDASGIMPATAESHAYFAVTGKPGGGRAHLSVKNVFNIIVMRVEDISMIIPSKC